MNATDEQGRVEIPLPLPRATAAVWSGVSAFAVAALAANFVVELVPHARGVGFFPQLRFAVVTGGCALAGIGGALAYRFIAGRLPRPRLTFAGITAGAGVLILLAIAMIGVRGLALAATPVVLCAAAIMAWLTPRLSEAKRRSRIAVAAFAALACLELVGVARGLASERAAPAGPAGMAFDVPRPLFDVDHKFVDLPSGAHVHYVDEGHGETLLFLHGNPSWSFQWRDLIRGLRGSYRCVALDYPGFGLSTAREGFGYTPREESHVVEEFVDRLGLHDITLVMQDWGGPVGFGFAGRRPELVRAIILGNTWAWQTPTSEARGKWSVVAGGPVGEFLQMNFDSVVSFGIASSVVRTLPPDVLDVYERPFLPLDRRGVATLYPQQITVAKDYFSEVEASLPRVADRRALIFWGLLDIGFPRSDLEHWERVLPSHEVVELPNANHFFFEDTADQVIDRIRSFVSAL